LTGVSRKYSQRPMKPSGEKFLPGAKVVRAPVMMARVHGAERNEDDEPADESRAARPERCGRGSRRETPCPDSWDLPGSANIPFSHLLIS